jgi:hypothetical protein
MIDTDKYEGHTEGKWYAETGANGEVQTTATVEIVSFHSDEFREKWLADASLRHEKQQDEHSIGDRTETLVSILGQVYQPDDEGSWFNEHNRLMLDDSYDEMQANMNLMADAPLILQALIDERAEVKRLRGLLNTIADKALHEVNTQPNGDDSPYNNILNIAYEGVIE